MDDIGTIIYILFVVISLLGGLWKNMNKKKEERASTPSPVPYGGHEHSYENLEEILEEKTQKELDAQRRLDEMRAKTAEARSKSRSFTKRSKGKPTLIEEKEIGKRRSSLTKDFDAKKAIIYSEIINPPYL